MEAILDIDRLTPNQYWDIIREMPSIPYVWGIKARNSAIMRGIQYKLSNRIGVFADFKHSETEGSMRSLGELYKSYGKVWVPDLVSINTDAPLAKIQAMQSVVEGTPTSLALVLVRSDMTYAECELEYGRRPEELCEYNADKALEAGLSAIICPGYLLSEKLAAKFKTVVATGVRSVGTSHDEHVKPIPPEKASVRGATHWVVGREVTLAPDPLKALESLAGRIGRYKP